MIIDTYVIALEMPREVVGLLPFEEMEEDSLMCVLEAMQKRYTMGFNFDVLNTMMYVLFQKEAERDFAFNELKNLGFQAIRKENVVQTDSSSWTEEGQERLKRNTEKWLAHTDKKIRKWKKRNEKS